MANYMTMENLNAWAKTAYENATLITKKLFTIALPALKYTVNGHFPLKITSEKCNDGNDNETTYFLYIDYDSIDNFYTHTHFIIITNDKVISIQRF